MSVSRLTKLPYSQSVLCDTDDCTGTAQTDSYGQVFSGLCLDCQVDATYDAKAEANGSVTFGHEGDSDDEQIVTTETPRAQCRPVISDEYSLNESAKNHRFMRRHQTKQAKVRKLIILERQLQDNEYFKRDLDVRYQDDHELWKEHSRHLVQRGRSIRQTLMRTWYDDDLRHNQICGIVKEHETCNTSGASFLGGNWRWLARRSKWYRNPTARRMSAALAIRESMNDLPWTQPALRPLKDPRLSKKQLEANRKEPQSEMPQMDQHYSFVEWLASLATLSKRSRKKYQMQRHGVAKVYTTVSNPDHFLPVHTTFYWPLKWWLGRRDWRYSRPIRVGGSRIWNEPRLTYVNSAPKKPYTDALAYKKGGANWDHIQIA